MNGDDFKELSEKINNIDKNVIEIKGGLIGHGDRIEKCEDDRKELFSMKNRHELRLTKIDSRHEAEIALGINRLTSKTQTFDWIMRILMALFALITLLFIIFKSFPVEGAGCPAQSQDKTEQEIKDIVNVFNNCPVAINYGMIFSCEYTEGSPILSCRVPLTTEQCLELRIKIKSLAVGISGDWFLYTGSKAVYIYNLEAILIYYIKSDGEFKCIFDNVT